MRPRRSLSQPSLVEPPSSSSGSGGVRGEQSVARDYTFTTTAGAISALFSFASATITTRLLAPTAFGALSLVLVTSLIIQTATSSWTSLAVSRFGREALELTGTMSAVSWTRLRLIGPWFVLATGVVLTLKALGGLPGQLSWLLVGLSILHGSIAVLYEHCMNLLRGWGRQLTGAIGLLSQQLVLVVVLATLLIFGLHTSVAAISGLYVAGSITLLGAYVPMLRKIAFSRVGRDRALERRMWRFSAPLIVFTISAYVIASVDFWILALYASARKVGEYAAAYRAYTVLMTVASAASPVLMTLFVSLRLARRGTEVEHFVDRVVPALVLVAGSLTAVLVAPGYLATPVVFGSRFAATALPLAILLVSLVGYLHCVLLGTVLTAFDRTRQTSRAVLLAAVLNVVADFIAIAVFGAGIWAPATATAAASILTAIGYHRATAELVLARIQFPWLAYAPAVIAVLALALSPAGFRTLVCGGAGIIAAAACMALEFRRGHLDRELVFRLGSVSDSARSRLDSGLDARRR